MSAIRVKIHVSNAQVLKIVKVVNISKLVDNVLNVIKKLGISWLMMFVKVNVEMELRLTMNSVMIIIYWMGMDVTINVN